MEERRDGVLADCGRSAHPPGKLPCWSSTIVGHLVPTISQYIIYNTKNGFFNTELFCILSAWSIYNTWLKLLLLFRKYIAK